MIETLKAIDESLFLFLNSQHNSFFDPLMWLFSEKLFWLPLYVWFLWLLYRKYPHHFWTVLVAVILMIVASDQLCNLVKESVMRFRPNHVPDLLPLLHTVHNFPSGNGSFGFYSAHASNAFAVALFMITAGAGKRSYMVSVCLTYALLTAYSRIYLGVHYPGDILIGAIIGTILGAGFAHAHARLRTRYLNPA